MLVDIQWVILGRALFNIVLFSLALFILSKKLNWKARWKAWIPGVRIYMWGKSLNLYQN